MVLEAIINSCLKPHIYRMNRISMPRNSTVLQYVSNYN